MNTQWAIGVVVYTGPQTKLMINQGTAKFKQSKIEKKINLLCIFLIVIQTILCLIMSILAGVYTSNYGSFDPDNLQTDAEYIFYSGGYYLGPDKQYVPVNEYNPKRTALLSYPAYFILLNTLIPISLVVTLEIVKTLQMPFIQHDVHMFDEETGQSCRVSSLTLHEELGTIDYIFADKTGTLTANIMKFQSCTVAGVCYDETTIDEESK